MRQPLFPPFYRDICATIDQVRPDLSSEAHSFGTRTPVEFGHFLNEHFPIDDDWLGVDIFKITDLFRDRFGR